MSDKGLEKSVQIAVDDVVISGTDMWVITGIYLGGIGQESVVGLKSVTKRPNGEMLVPMALVADKIWTKRWQDGAV